MFFMSQRTVYFLPQGQRVGWGIKKREGWTSQHSSKYFVFLGLPLLFGFHDDDTEKSGETIAPPPKRGFLPAPIAALWDMPLSGPRGSLSSLLIPAGRPGIAPRRAAETTETDL